MAVILLKLTAFSALFFFLFNSSSASLQPSPPPTAATSATGILRVRGYSLMADILEFASRSAGNLDGWNGTGTIFAPSDSAFKNHHRHRFLRPSASLLLYHTSRSPPLLWSDLSTRPAGSSIRTFSSRRRRCIFLRRTPAGDPCLAESAVAKKIRHRPCIRIRDPDLFYDGDLAVHGIDGVLDPFAASTCRLNTWQGVPHFEGVLRALRRKGYGAVAKAMEARQSELEGLSAVTVFAVKDGDLPYGSDGFRHDLHHHVTPSRYHLHDLARLSMGSRIETMATGAKIAVGSDVDGAVTVNGVAVDGDEVYHNRWAVVLSVKRPLGFDQDSDVSSVNRGIGEAPSPAMMGGGDHSDSAESVPSSLTDSLRFDDGDIEYLPLESSSGQHSFDKDAAVSAPSGAVQECCILGPPESTDNEVASSAPMPRGDDPADVVRYEWCLLPGERHVAPCSLDGTIVRVVAL